MYTVYINDIATCLGSRQASNLTDVKQKQW